MSTNQNIIAICNHCFDRKIINKLIAENGMKDFSDYLCIRCSICSRKSEDDIFYIEKDDLLEKLAEAIKNLYVHIDQYTLAGGGRESYVSLEQICSKFCDLCGDKVAQMISDEFSWEHKDGGGSFGDINDPEWLPICWLEQEGLNWDRFSQEVKHSLRFFDTNNLNRKEELQKLDRFFERICISDLKREVFRSRGIHEDAIETVKSNPETELGIAPSKLAKHNRFSPTGISYMYLASDEQTAIHEVFDEIYYIYPVGQFELKENLKIIDLRKSSVNNYIEKYTNPFSNEFESSIFCASEVIEKFVEEIQKPIDNESKDLEYLPTQILAEYIRFLGYKGFIFDSSKNIDGYNIVLFANEVIYREYKLKRVSSTTNLKISKFVDA